MVDLTELPAWTALQKHREVMGKKNIESYAAKGIVHDKRFLLSEKGITVNYANNIISDETITLLCELARQCDLEKKIQGLFSGECVNQSENLPALHTALRQTVHSPIYVNGENVIPIIEASLDKIEKIVNQVRDGDFRGYSGQAIKDVVNIGIGGSDLGPIMTCSALQAYKDTEINIHFFCHYEDCKKIETLNPETTLFVVSSKSFATQETLFIAKNAKQWLEAANTLAPNKQMLAITAKSDLAIEFGICPENVLTLWDWVGGRFSIWSAIGITLAITIGMEQFKLFLKGAESMDRHFQTSPFHTNMPVILALLDFWYINFFQFSTKVIIPYSKRLYHLPEFLQQLHMESLGKNVRQDGKPVNYATGVAVWGSIGSNSQHSFHQILMQGTFSHSVDFILPVIEGMDSEIQKLLEANCVAQSQVMMQGYQPEGIESHKKLLGGAPSNIIVVDPLTPFNLGALLALYEHKVVVQAAIWDINPFDQWGVERGKVMANRENTREV